MSLLELPGIYEDDSQQSSSSSDSGYSSGSSDSSYSSSNYSSSSSSSKLSDEEIALRLVEIYAKNMRINSVDVLIKYYFEVLEKLKNKNYSSDSTTSTSSSQSYSSLSGDDEEDTISKREYLSDSDADSASDDLVL